MLPAYIIRQISGCSRLPLPCRGKILVKRATLKTKPVPENFLSSEEGPPPKVARKPLLKQCVENVGKILIQIVKAKPKTYLTNIRSESNPL